MPKSTVKKKISTKKKVVKKENHPKPYHELNLYQKKMRDEKQKLHHDTETFVRVAVKKSIKKNTVHDIEKHILDIGKNIDELEDILHGISKRK